MTPLMAFLRESFDRRQLRFNHTSTAGGVEDWKVNWSDEIHSASVGRWRRELAPSVTARAWSACGDLWREIDPCLDRLAGPPPEADPVEGPVS